MIMRSLNATVPDKQIAISAVGKTQMRTGQVDSRLLKIFNGGGY